MHAVFFLFHWVVHHGHFLSITCLNFNVQVLFYILIYSTLFYWTFSLSLLLFFYNFELCLLV